MKVVRQNTPFGVQIEGLDPKAVTPADGATLRELLAEHRVLEFRDLELPPQRHVELMGHFGRVIVEMPDPASLADPTRLFGKVSFVTTRPGEYISGRDKLSFHSDFSFYSDGAGEAFSLYAIQADCDDPTIFANMARAAQLMPAELLAELRKLSIVKCANFFHNSSQDFGPRYRITDREAQKDYGNTASIHPAIWRHPKTGEEIINICQTFTSHVHGWSYEQSDALFAQVEPWLYRDETIYRHRWQTGDLVIWDNVALQHGRDPVANFATRDLQRVIASPWSVNELLQRTGEVMSPRDPSLLPAA